VIAIITEITAKISESILKVPGKHDIKKLQKTDILDTAHILGKVLI
jgi:hypothetical protein